MLASRERDICCAEGKRKMPLRKSCSFPHHQEGVVFELPSIREIFATPKMNCYKGGILSQRGAQSRICHVGVDDVCREHSGGKIEVLERTPTREPISAHATGYSVHLRKRRRKLTGCGRKKCISAFESSKDLNRTELETGFWEKAHVSLRKEGKGLFNL